MFREQWWVIVLNYPSSVMRCCDWTDASMCPFLSEWRKETKIWHFLISHSKQKQNVHEAAKRRAIFSASIITGSTTDFFGVNYIRRTMGLTEMVWEVSADGTVTQRSECLSAEHMLALRNHAAGYFCPAWLECTATKFAQLVQTQSGLCCVSVSLKQQVRSRCVSHQLIGHSGVWGPHLREMNGLLHLCGLE